MNKLKLRIYDCFDKLLPVPDGRHNPFDPRKNEKHTKNHKSKGDVRAQSSKEDEKPSEQEPKPIA